MLTAATMTLSGCSDNTNGESSKSADTDSSYYGVNYTDTGDPESGFGNSTANVDHSSAASDDKKASGNETSAENVSSDRRRQSSRSSDASSKGTTTKTTVTYYYTDENGEHATDTEVYITTDTDVRSVSSVTSSAAESETDTARSTDTDTDISTDAASETPVSVGSFDESDLTFEYSGALITYGANIEDIVAVIGEPVHIDNIPNGENPEFDNKTYNYELFSIETEPSQDGTVYTVCGMQIFDDSLSTSKGVYIGMPTIEAVRTYGNDYMICDDEYRYYIGSRYMYLYVQNSIVANIGYGYDKDLSTE